MVAMLSGCEAPKTEWKVVDPGKPFEFNHPSLTNIRPSFYGFQDPYRFTINYQGSWVGRDGNPRASMSFYQLDPNRGWRERTIKLDSESVRASWRYFKDMDIVASPLQETKNRYGNVQFVTFQASGKVQCLAFGQMAGSLTGDMALNWATAFIRGFYCGAPGKEIKEADAREILQSFVVTAKGAEKL